MLACNLLAPQLQQQALLAQQRAQQLAQPAAAFAPGAIKPAGMAGVQLPKPGGGAASGAAALAAKGGAAAKAGYGAAAAVKQGEAAPAKKAGSIGQKKRKAADARLVDKVPQGGVGNTGGHQSAAQ